MQEKIFNAICRYIIYYHVYKCVINIGYSINKKYNIQVAMVKNHNYNINNLIINKLL